MCLANFAQSVLEFSLTWLGRWGGVKLLRAPRQGIRGWLYAPEEAEPWEQKEQGWGS